METIIIPVVTGIAQVLKIGGFPKRFVPALALGVGIALTYVTGVSDPILMGLVYGLSGVGLYSGVKGTFKE